MIKAGAVLAIIAFVGAGFVATPYISKVAAGEPVALAKGDRFDIRPDCSEQVWPNLTPSCIKGSGNAEQVRLVR